MTHSDIDIRTWLRAHCQRDRVLQNALNLPKELRIGAHHQGWLAQVVSRRGVKHRVVIVMHPVTGEPERWFRVAVDGENAT